MRVLREVIEALERCTDILSLKLELLALTLDDLYLLCAYYSLKFEYTATKLELSRLLANTIISVESTLN